MLYKVFPIDVLWSPKDSTALQLWKEDGTRWPKLLARVLNPVPFRSIWGNDELWTCEKKRFINSIISKYIEFWKLGMSKDDLYFRVMGSYVKYWENILELLLKPIPWRSSILLEGFWPSSNWKTNYERTPIPIVVDVDPKDLIILPYCGPKSMHHSLDTVAYAPFCDLFVGNFVLL
jgi:hypothetical protein